ncbi:hypothetical protein [Vibrio scophthalmi]|uniref:Trp operon repressor n=1 Tax=Vibrio scophthalmi TaxID=45658 RepID=A0A1C7FHM5_9VIBR|nr:hypothetical protein [Vibrio scophthalmi]ANU39431.1 hypothetical protein VSVS05_04396 [Vibrio scophthalmi]
MRQFLTETQLDALLSLYSERDFPEKTREAVRLRIINGHTYELAEFITGVSKRNIYRGVVKLKRAHEIVTNEYGVR